VEKPVENFASILKLKFKDLDVFFVSEKCLWKTFKNCQKKNVFFQKKVFLT